METNDNVKNQFILKLEEVKSKATLLKEVESNLFSESKDVLSKINKIISDLEVEKRKLLDLEFNQDKPKLWIYGCSMSNKHDYPDHSKSWYTLLAKKLDYDLEIRSHMAYGINAIERNLIQDLSKINRGRDLVIFSPSFFHRVYIEEFDSKFSSFLPNSKKLDWYKYLKDIDKVIQDNYERWISACELMITLNIDFRTWLLDEALAEGYPFKNGKRIAKFEHLILKPPVSPKALSWMAYQKEHPEFWYDDEYGKEDHHWNVKGHEFVSEEFYKQIFNRI